MIFLGSAALGCLAAFTIPPLFYDIFLLPFSQQVWILLVAWCLFGVVFYLLLFLGAGRFDSLRALFAPKLDFYQIVRKIFLAAFFLFPVCLIAAQHVREFTQIIFYEKVYDAIGWLPSSQNNGLFLSWILVLIFLSILGLFFAAGQARVRRSLESIPDRYYILFILSAALLLRLAFIYSVDTQPTSDFANINSDALLVSQGKQPVNIYVSTHIAITFIYAFLYKLFGPDLMVLKVFNGLTYGLAGIFMFYAGKKIFATKLWAGISALSLVLWPSLALYSNVPTPEHLFILAECAFLFAIAWLFERQETAQGAGWWKDVPVFALIGALLGFSGVFRPFGEMFLTAFIIALLVFKSGHWKIAARLAGIAVVFVVFWSFGRAQTSAAEFYHKNFPNVRPCNLLVGMNTATLGQYNVADGDLCREIRSTSSNSWEFNTRIVKIVLERLYAEPDAIISFVGEKFAILWENSSGFIYWTIRLVPPDDNAGLAVERARDVNLVDFAFMFVGTMACMAGAVIAFFKDVKPAVFFTMLAFFAFNLLEVFFEVQTRYRTIIMPLFILLACWVFAVAYTRGHKAAEQPNLVSTRDSQEPQ